MPKNFQWHGPKFEVQVTQHMARNMAAACIYLANYARTLISTEGAGKAESKPTKGKGTGKKKSKKLAYGANPSAPGDPPHVQTGRLRASVTWEVAAAIGRVGTNVKYGRWLELGTKHLAARPWLRRALNETRGFVARILTRPMK